MSNYPGALSGGFVSHRFVSLKSDQPDLSVVNPSNWNQSHIIGSGAIQSGALGSGVTLPNSVVVGALQVPTGTPATPLSGANPQNEIVGYLKFNLSGGTAAYVPYAQ